MTRIAAYRTLFDLLFRVRSLPVIAGGRCRPASQHPDPKHHHLLLLVPASARGAYEPPRRPTAAER